MVQLPAGGDAPAAGRIGWLDAARGLGIVLVVIGHALGGIIDSPLGTGSAGEPGGDLGAFRRAFFVIYTFHMPLFFVLAGLLVSARIARGARAFAAGLLPGVIAPYFLWSVLQFSVIWALGSAVNHPAGNWLDTIVALPWRTVSQFWFLHALFWLHVIALAALPRLGREGLVLVGLAAKALAVIVPVPPPVKLVMINLVWYAIGVWLTPDGLCRLVVDRPLIVRAAVLPGLAAGVIGLTLGAAGQFGADLPLMRASSPEIANLAWRLPALAAAIFGLLAVAGLASLPMRSGVAALEAIGRRTMPVFLLHVLFIAGTRIALTRGHLVRDPAALLAILVIAGIVGPLLAERGARRLRLPRWTGL